MSPDLVREAVYAETGLRVSLHTAHAICERLTPELRKIIPRSSSVIEVGRVDMRQRPHAGAKENSAIFGIGSIEIDGKPIDYVYVDKVVATFAEGDWAKIEITGFPRARVNDMESAGARVDRLIEEGILPPKVA